MLFEKFHIDDPCSAFVTHGICGIWGMISVGLFAKTDTFTGPGDDIWNKNPGVFYGGGKFMGKGEKWKQQSSKNDVGRIA